MGSSPSSSPGPEQAQVTEGISAEGMTKVPRNVESVLEKAAKSPQLDNTHFISIPLAIYPELGEKLLKFQETVIGAATSSDNDMGIDKSIFIKPKTFHLTVLMLKLWDKDRIDRAIEVLEKISSKVNDALDNRPVSVKLKGLECMRGSASKAWVLYAPVMEIGAEGRLLRACQVITEAYVEAGLVLEKDARQELKLHATVMNARYRKRTEETRRDNSFDARWILKRYASEEWGDYLIRGAHLSQRFLYDEGGYYHCCASIPFPESMPTVHNPLQRPRPKGPQKTTKQASPHHPPQTKATGVGENQHTNLQPPPRHSRGRGRTQTSTQHKTKSHQQRQPGSQQTGLLSNLSSRVGEGPSHTKGDKAVAEPARNQAGRLA